MSTVERWSTVVDAAAATAPDGAWRIRAAEALIRSHYRDADRAAVVVEWVLPAAPGRERAPWTPGTPVPDGVTLVVCRGYMVATDASVST